MTCIVAGCSARCHAAGNRFCADHLIEHLGRSLDRATQDTLQGRGLPLRDWFAGQALATHVSHRVQPEETAEYAYRVADAMLAAREASQ